MSKDKHEECGGCGSNRKDRERYKAQHGNEPEIPLQLLKCRHCGACKCCMCDMGNDVGCIACDESEDD